MPFVRRLIDHEDVVAEYGHQHVVRGIGTFKSRFTLAELGEIDRNRGEATGTAILPASRGGLFPRFLESASRAQYPFAREARLHINSRNRNLTRAKNASTDTERIEYSTRAVRENRILNQFFAQTVEHAKERLPERRASNVESQADPMADFYSRVDRHLITFASQTQLLGCVIAAIVLLAAVDLRLHRYR